MIDRHGLPVSDQRLSGLSREAAQFLPLAGPMILSRLGISALGIVDGLMLAQHSTRQLALHGLGDGLAARLLEVGMAFTMAGLGLAAQARAGNAAERLHVGHIWRQSLLLALAVGFVGMLLAWFARPLLSWLGLPFALAEGGGRVLAVLGLGMVPGLAAMACAGMLEVLGKGRWVAIAVVAANILNIALNSWLMGGPFGGHPVPAEGVAWATTVVRVLLAIGLAAALWWIPQGAALGMRRRFGRSAWNAGAEQRARGWQAAGPAALMAVLAMCMPLMAAWLGERALATMTALIVLLSPLMAIGWGLADAAGVRVATTLGQSQQKPGAVQRTGTRCATLLVFVMALASAFYTLTPRPLARLLVAENALADQVAVLLPMALLVVVLESLAMMYANALRGLGEARWPAMIQVAVGLVTLPAAGMLAITMGAGVLGLLVMQAVSAALRVLTLAPLYRHTAEQQDQASVKAMRARAAAIAHGWADTVLLWPGASTQRPADTRGDQGTRRMPATARR